MATVHIIHTCDQYPHYKIEEVHRFDGYATRFFAKNLSTVRSYFTLAKAKKALRARMPAKHGERVTWTKKDPFE